jgi:hypothetical protein
MKFGASSIFLMLLLSEMKLFCNSTWEAVGFPKRKGLIKNITDGGVAVIQYFKQRINQSIKEGKTFSVEARILSVIRISGHTL